MSPASDQPRIPVELFDAIMDYADAGTQATCSLSCRHWSPTARRHRFRMVHIQPRADSRPLSALLLCDPTSTVLPGIRDRMDERGSSLARRDPTDHPCS
ncbi:uncharacterized protein B0H18DRAFT_1044229 [Fomitopsis serialis]|uniref:uncharacterized protein n=1 Tax=Fomitopsis serialis TaxID=139415 RepID=UPI00200740BF|nr:uncharacterized protein B0H18DRAFT_1044229 [Neoantrodia serialis]KAH9914685.1 hypothetical protein B0H18DRAFT_1044229 [Neoantrodia serialis]